jgi:IS5 family transposase
VKKTKPLYPRFSNCSFDKGFHSLGNQKQLAEELEQCTMPKKGKRNKADNERENSAEFKRFAVK